MLREVVVFLCAAGIVSASITHPNPVPEDNQTSVAVSSEVSSSQPQQDIPFEAKILQSQVTANTQQAPTLTNEQAVPYTETSSGIHAYVASPDLRYSISPAIVSALPEAAPVSADKKVESQQQVDPEESSVPVPVVQPVQTEVQPVVDRPAVQYVSALIGNSQLVQSTGKNSSNTIQETLTAHVPSAAYVNSALPQFIDHVRTVPLHPSFQYAPIPVSDLSPGIVKTMSVVPKKEITVETQKSVTVHPATYVTPRPVFAQPIYYQPQIVARPPVVKYLSAPFKHRYPAFQGVTAYPQSIAPLPINEFKTVFKPTVQTSHIKPVFVRPITPAPSKSVTIESHQSVTAHPTTSGVPIQHIQTFGAPTSVEHRYPAFQTVTAFPSSAAYVSPAAAAPFPIQEVKIAPKPAVHLLPVKPVLVRPVAPAPSKSVTIESHQSVTAHPPTPVAPIRQVQTFAAPPPVQYVTGAAPPAIATEETSFPQYGGNSFVNYAPPPIVTRPIPVPVIYSPGAPQFIAVPKQPQPAPAIVSYPSPVTGIKPIPVPVAYPKSEAFIKYNPGVDTSLVYSKSLVEKNHASADLVSTHITPGHGYARVLSYSPSSAVSSVSFNGLGVSYGWR